MLPFVHETRIRVRYAETDQMGVVWHGNYLQYFEEARTEALRVAGWSYRALEEAGVMMPLVEVHLAYRHPARYDDLLAVRTVVSTPPTARMRFDYEISDEHGVCLVTGHTVLGFVNAATRHPCRPPLRLRALFADSGSAAGGH
jgi:acyl-CoA thioester hydrolase